MSTRKIKYYLSTRKIVNVCLEAHQVATILSAYPLSSSLGMSSTTIIINILKILQNFHKEQLRNPILLKIFKISLKS